MGPARPPPDRASPIGVFDSGVGGLTVAAAIAQQLPAERLIYLGDTARLPYGSKSPETVRRYALKAAGFLLARGVKALVIACNTASALALDHLRQEAPVPVLGVIEPGAAAAAAATRGGRIGVIGTAGTIASGAYQAALGRLLPGAAVSAHPCPLFVPLAEEGFVEHPATALIAATYLAPLRAEGIDTLVLGCTHYPLLRPVIAAALPGVTLVDSAGTTAEALRRTLGGAGLLAAGPATTAAPGQREFFATDVGPRFQEVARHFFGPGFSTLEHVDIV